MRDEKELKSDIFNENYYKKYLFNSERLGLICDVLDLRAWHISFILNVDELHIIKLLSNCFYGEGFENQELVNFMDKISYLFFSCLKIKYGKKAGRIIYNKVNISYGLLYE